MKTIKLIILLITVTSSLLFTSCDSALSDIEITDPSLIKAELLVSKTITKNGSDIESVTALLLDKNMGFIYLNNGHVMVNGEEVDYNSTINTYVSYDFELNKGENFVFDIILASGDTVSSSVTMPGYEFGTFTMPTEFNIANDLEVSWTDIDPNGEVEIKLDIKSDVDDEWRNIIETTVQDTGGYVIPASVFDETYHVGQADITIKRKTAGSIHPDFMSGSEINANIIQYQGNINMIK